MYKVDINHTQSIYKFAIINMKNLFSETEIRLIEKEANNPWYKQDNILIQPEDYKSIIKVTEKGLVFIYGNSDTGLNHINERHRHRNGNYKLTKGKVENPSLFNLNACSIKDYTQIADEIFVNGKKVLDKTGSELFVVYKGNYQNDEYKLVLYKGSRIIHTLYPQKKKNNISKRQLIKYVLGEMKATHLLSKNVYTVTIPYVNSEDIVKYAFHFRLKPEINIEELWIEIKNNPQHHDLVILINEKKIHLPDANYKEYIKKIFGTFEMGKVIILEKLIDKIERRGIGEIHNILKELNKNNC